MNEREEQTMCPPAGERRASDRVAGLRMSPVRRAGAVFATGALVAAAATGAPAVPLQIDPKELRRGEARYQKAEGSTVGAHTTAESAAAAVAEAQESLARAAHAILAREGVLVSVASATVAPVVDGAAGAVERLVVRAASCVSADGEGVHVPDGQLFWASLDRLAAASADFAMLGGYDTSVVSDTPEAIAPGEPAVSEAIAPGEPAAPEEAQWN